MSYNFDHDLEYRPGQDNEFISSDQDLYSTQFVGQPGAFESVVNPCPIDFQDFILFPEESDEEEPSLDTSSVPETSGEMRLDQIHDEAEAMLTVPTDAAMLRLLLESFNHVDVDMEQSQPFVADGIGNSQQSVDNSGASAFAPWNFVQLADHLIPEPSPESEPILGSLQEQSESLSRSGIEDVDHKLCVPRARSFNCYTCAQVFSSQARLSAHNRQTHAPRRFSCASCGRMFHTRKDLRRHEVTHNDGPRDFACTCGKDYLRRDHLLRHISSQHERHDNGYHEAMITLP